MDTGKQTATEQVTLTNGKYEYQSTMCSPRLCTFILSDPEFIDINGDGARDVIAIGSSWTGGNKSIVSVEIFLDSGSSLIYVGSVLIGAGTTPPVNSITAGKNLVTIEYNSTYNGAAGWSDPVSVTYKVENGALIKVR